MNKMDEMIIVAPRRAILEDEALAFQGTLKDKMLVNRIERNVSESYSIMRRGDAEIDETYKQPIPYAVIRRGDKVFAYQRLQGAGETRLHGKLSIGVGGHMNSIEGKRNFSEILHENLMREIEEELIIEGDGKFEIKTIGLINDDEDETGRVHLGFLVVIDISDQTVRVRETEELAGGFVSIKALKAPSKSYDRLENWSKIAINIL